MTAPHAVPPVRLLGQALGDASPDLMRHLLTTLINALLSAGADAVCGAEWGQQSPDRGTQRYSQCAGTSSRGSDTQRRTQRGRVTNGLRRRELREHWGLTLVA